MQTIIMNNLDYEIMIRNDDLSIRREPYKRSTRILKQFGENYSLDNVSKHLIVLFCNNLRISLNIIKHFI